MVLGTVIVVGMYTLMEERHRALIPLGNGEPNFKTKRNFLTPHDREELRYPTTEKGYSF